MWATSCASTRALLAGPEPPEQRRADHDDRVLRADRHRVRDHGVGHVQVVGPRHVEDLADGDVVRPQVGQLLLADPDRVDRYICRSARSYCHSISLRTTVSSIGIAFSAAVAARSAGCSYALGEMLGYGSIVSGRAIPVIIAGQRLGRGRPATLAHVFVFKAAVVGAGTMGGEIAQTIANADIPVVLKDVEQKFVDAGLEKARSLWQGRVDAGQAGGRGARAQARR